MKKNMSLSNIEYSIYRPAGNDTAFVYGLDYTHCQRKQINDAIMLKHPNVEQVGFINLNGKPELQMAGGEFCGNATRSAAHLYLNGIEGNLKIIVNSKDIINAGVNKDGNAWCEIPLYHGKDVVTEKEEGIFIVKMNGMVSVVVKEEVSQKYLKNRDNLKDVGMDFIHKYNLEDSEAVGIMFCERENNVLKINPIVWVKSINTLFYETACGSGTTAVSMVEAFINKKSQIIEILQPSGLFITADICYKEKQIVSATIMGKIEIYEKKCSLKILFKEENDMTKRRIEAITIDKVGDFITLYTVFRKHPYYEDWTDEAIYNQYKDLTEHGYVYGCYLENKCVGIVTFRPMRIEDRHPVHYTETEKIAYISDLSVLQEYRGKGIGSSLMQYALDKLKKENYNRVYMKTLEVGKSMSYGIAIKLGFNLIEGVTSIDRMKRTIEGIKEEDVKIYLDKEL